MSDVVVRLKADLTRAMRGGERATVSVLRTLLSAIANAEAQQVPDDVGPPAPGSLSVAGADAGVGSTDVRRRVLTETDIREVVASERGERLTAAETLRAAGRDADADRLREEARLLDRYLR